jgi:cytochrome c553
MSVAAMSVIGCGGQHEPEPASSGSPGQASLQERMHDHFRAIQYIYQALLVDDLDAAKARARELSQMPGRTGSREWDDAVRFLRAEADRLADAANADDARSLSTGMATYCADCHMRRVDPAAFRPAAVPPNDGSLPAAMARHEWAAETMWLGVIAPSTDLWREGLAEMASVPRLVGHGKDAAEVETLRARLGALATGSSELRGQGDRARRLAEIMDVCAACHAITRRDGERPGRR